jgi:hypothetical protein
MSMKPATLAILVLTLGCASALRSGPAGANARKIADAEAEMARLEAALSAHQAEERPDCVWACKLLANICALSDRICELGRQDDALRGRCQDARQRCARARTSVAGRCACPDGP